MRMISEDKSIQSLLLRLKSIIILMSQQNILYKTENCFDRHQARLTIQ